MTLLGWSLLAYAVLAALGGLASTLVWIHMVDKVNASGITPRLREWGRASWGEQRRVLRVHRELYPGSSLRTIYMAIVSILVASFVLVAAQMFTQITTHTAVGRPASTSSSQR
jgi:hypothetical protein